MTYMDTNSDKPYYPIVSSALNCFTDIIHQVQIFVQMPLIKYTWSNNCLHTIKSDIINKKVTGD